ncbi:hypothetical protein HK098_003825 [Nowakowskiella sp. JEL0407]|nr:hypothetical protein HK098_003825 [Nowakowskiella sp. JEL0407]
MLKFDILFISLAFILLFAKETTFNVSAQTPNANLGSWSLLPVTQLVTCIHSMLLPGPYDVAPGTKPKLLCVERPHGGGKGKYPPNPYVEPDGTRSNAAEIDLLAPAGSTPAQYAKISKAINNPFCAGHAQMADGSILVAGGDREAATAPDGTSLLIDGTNIKRIYKSYDPTPANMLGDPVTKLNAGWNDAGAMSKGRWYPTVHTISDGSQIIVGGVAVALDLDEYKNKGTRNLNPTYEFQPSKGAPVNLQILQDTDPWNLFPVVQQLTSGRIWIFVGSPSVLLTPATGAIEPVANMTDILHHPRIYPYTSTSAMLPLHEKTGYKNTIMLCGGTLKDNPANATLTDSTGTASNYCSRINPDEPNAKWEENFIRFPGAGKVMPDVVLMPDGNVLFVNGAIWGTAGGDAGVVNGAHDPNFETFVYNATSGTFEKGPNFTVARLYHSGALLLPDGRVITTGNEEANYKDLEGGATSKIMTNKCFPSSSYGVNFTSANNDPTAGCGDPFEYRIELFTPYYYNKPTQPVIKPGYGTSYPTQVTYGSNFWIQFTSDARQVDRIVFIRYATTTHSTNMDQRMIVMDWKFKNQTHLIVNVPPNGNVAPPGNWMVFPVGVDGSVGHSVTIRIGAGAPVVNEVPKMPVTTNGVGSGGNSSSGGEKVRYGVIGTVVTIFAIILVNVF